MTQIPRSFSIRSPSSFLVRGWLLLLALLLSTFIGLCVADLHLGALTNGVPATTAISQGDSHYWTFAVSANDSITGSPLVDLIFVLQNAEGQCALFVTAPDGTQTASQLAGANGAMYNNQSANATSSSSKPVLYGQYTVQVYAIASDTYTLSSSMTRRQQLQSSATQSVGGVAGSTALTLSTYTYADYVVWQPGPVQVTISLTVDDAALLQAGVALSSVQLPVLYWAKQYNVPAWQPSATTTSGQQVYSTADATLSGLANSPLYAVVSYFDECTPDALPCTYTFLVVPQQNMPALPLLTISAVDLTNASSTSSYYNSALDYTQTQQAAHWMDNITISTPLTLLGTNSVQFYRFPVLDAQEVITLTLSTVDITTSVVVLMSPAVEFPDTTAAGYVWAFACNASVLSSTFVVTVADRYFSGAYGQQVTMEGWYQVTVYAQVGGHFTLQLNISDRSNETAPLLGTNQLYTGVLRSRQRVYFRYLTPSGFDPSESDLLFTVYNASLYGSDFWPTPGPDGSNGQPNIIDAYSIAISTPLVVQLNARYITNHIGVYYLCVYNLAARDTTFSILVTVNVHVTLSLNSMYVSDAPLFSGAVRYFDLRQPAGTT